METHGNSWNLLERSVCSNREYGNALQAAASEGHETLLKLLLDRGAELNARFRSYGNALQVVANKDNKEVVQLLLDLLEPKWTC